MYRVKPSKVANWPFLARVLHKVYRAFARDPKRRTILKKITNLDALSKCDSETISFSIHLFLCERDFNMGVASCKALALVANVPVYFIFHDDGTLKAEHLKKLKYHFPNSKVIARLESDRYMDNYLEDYPKCRELRKTHKFALKIMDVRAYAVGERVAYMDTDVLFFREPSAFLMCYGKDCKKNYFNRDISTRYAISPSDAYKVLGVSLVERLNSGLWVMNRDDMDLNILEEWLDLPIVKCASEQYVMDQTFLALLASKSKHGVAYLPEPYDVSFEKHVEESVCKHYVGLIRHGFELEGLIYLCKHLDFVSRWNAFVKGC